MPEQKATFDAATQLASWIDSQRDRPMGASRCIWAYYKAYKHVLGDSFLHEDLLDAIDETVREHNTSQASDDIIAWACIQRLVGFSILHPLRHIMPMHESLESFKALTLRPEVARANAQVLHNAIAAFIDDHLADSFEFTLLHPEKRSNLAVSGVHNRVKMLVDGTRRSVGAVMREEYEPMVCFLALVEMNYIAAADPVAFIREMSHMGEPS